MAIDGEKKCPICKCNFLAREVTDADDSIKCKSCHKLYPDGIGDSKKDEATKLFLGREEVQSMITKAMETLKDEILCIMVSEQETSKEEVVAETSDESDELDLDSVEENNEKNKVGKKGK